MTAILRALLIGTGMLRFITIDAISAFIPSKILIENMDTLEKLLTTTDSITENAVEDRNYTLSTFTLNTILVKYCY